MDDQTSTKIDISIDTNGDGKIEDVEMKAFLQREKHQRNMAYIALAGIIGACAYVLLWSDVEKIQSVGDLLDMYFISLSGIIATSMGVGAWLARRK